MQLGGTGAGWGGVKQKVWLFSLPFMCAWVCGLCGFWGRLQILTEHSENIGNIYARTHSWLRINNSTQSGTYRGSPFFVVALPRQALAFWLYSALTIIFSRTTTLIASEIPRPGAPARARSTQDAGAHTARPARLSRASAGAAQGGWGGRVGVEGCQSAGSGVRSARESKNREGRLGSDLLSSLCSNEPRPAWLLKTS